MRGAHGAVTNYLPVGVNHRRDLEVNSGFSRVYDNALPSISERSLRSLFWNASMRTSPPPPFTLASALLLFFSVWKIRGKKADISCTLHFGDMDLRVLRPRSQIKLIYLLYTVSRVLVYIILILKNSSYEEDFLDINCTIKNIS